MSHGTGQRWVSYVRPPNQRTPWLALRVGVTVGAAIMGGVLAWRPLRKRAGLVMFMCVTIFGTATIIFGLSRSFYLSLVMLFAIGASDMVSVIIRGTLVQVNTPPAMRGRVSAVNMLFIGTSIATVTSVVALVMLLGVIVIFAPRAPTAFSTEVAFAVASAADCQPFRIGPAFRDQELRACGDILEFAACTVLDVHVAEFFPVASRQVRG